MGIRGHLPLALSALLVGACDIDFADPVFPNAGAPALVTVSVSLQPQGVAFVNGRVQPGRDSTGVTRVPADSTLFVAGFAIEADTVEARNTLVFSELLQLSESQLRDSIVIATPPIHGIFAEPPRVRWYGMVRVGPDTVSVGPGEDLVLRVESRLGTADPPVQVRQWFMDLNGPTGTFRLSGTGFPPDTLRIPPQWIPATGPASVFASLLYYQSATLRPEPGDYIGSISMDARVQWSIRVR